MDIKQLENKIDEFSLPVFPRMLVQVTKVSSDEYASTQDLAEIILKDQSLTSKILAIANSAFYGFYRQVSTITQAIIVLGFESVKNITFGITAYNSLSSFSSKSCLTQFWEHSFATGLCAELLAEKMGYTPSEEAFVAGLLHDVGKILLSQIYPEQYQEVVKLMLEHDAYSHVVESSILGVNHCTVGEMMAKKWGLPLSLQASIRDHHKKAWGANTLTDIVSFSDFIIQSLSLDRKTKKFEQLVNLGSTELNLKPDSIKAVVQTLAERLDEYSTIFEIRLDNLLDYTAMIEQECAKLKKSSTSKALSKKEEEMSILTEISTAMIKGRPQKEILQMVLEGLIRLEEVDKAIVFATNTEKSIIRGKLGLGENAAEFCSAFSMSLNKNLNLIVRAVQLGEKQVIKKHEAGTQQTTQPGDDILSELGVSSACIIPLSIREKNLGALMVAWKKAKTSWGEELFQTLSLFANQASLLLGMQEEGNHQKETVSNRKRSSLLLDID